MSILFGLKRVSGARIDEHEIFNLGSATMPWAPDGTFVHVDGSQGFGYQPYHTHFRSSLAGQPQIDSCGNVGMLDGRFDNYEDICTWLGVESPEDTSDVEILLAALRRWGTDSFAKFVGDWAIAVWSAKDESLYLARDHAGTRTLYYRNTGDTLFWSTYLDTLVAINPPDVDPPYLSRYLACHPLGTRTPYRGIRAVPPGQIISFSRGKQGMLSHWTIRHRDEIRYCSDMEYEEHFMSLFATAVKRRIGEGAPILAQLSGGMDSTGIICLADDLTRRGDSVRKDLLQTVSFYDDAEPTWNEKQFFSIVEKHRGKQGFHIPVSYTDRDFSEPPSIYRLPGSDGQSLLNEEHFEEAIGGVGFRVVLSGIGGDELLGGNPNCAAELANYLVSGRLIALARRGFAWALTRKEPFIYELSAAIRYLSYSYPILHKQKIETPPWLSQPVVDTNDSEHTFIDRMTLGMRPSEIDGAATWTQLLETLPHKYPPVICRREYRYPYLDRDLVDFLLRVPPEQLAHPGRRRYLMRNSLRGVVPPEILERKQKGHIVYGPLVLLRRYADRLNTLFSSSLLEQMGQIHAGHFLKVLNNLTSGAESRWVRCAMRTISAELWLRSYIR